MTEAIPDLQRIFSTDPLKLTKEDISATVDYFRKRRQEYLAGDRKAGDPKKMKEDKPKAAKGPKGPAPAVEVGDLEF